MCMTSDPYAAGYTFARSAFTGGAHSGPKGRTYDIYIYIYINYIYIYTDSEIIVLTRWGSLSLAPIINIQLSVVTVAFPYTKSVCGQCSLVSSLNGLADAASLLYKSPSLSSNACLRIIASIKINSVSVLSSFFCRRAR